MNTAVENKVANGGSSLLEAMFQAGAHFGYSKTKRHPSYKPLLFGSKDKIDIIDLEKTGSYLNTALEFIRESAKSGKVVLFVGTKPEAQRALEELVIPLGVPYVNHRWIGGVLTNLSEIKKRIARLEELQGKKEKKELDVYTKKERLLFDREIDDLLHKFGGIVNMKQLPDVLFVVDPRHEYTVVNEALRKHIPIVALAGSDCDLAKVQYPIPANDASFSSIRFFVQKVMDSYKEGLKARVEATAKEIPVVVPPPISVK